MTITTDDIQTLTNAVRVVLEELIEEKGLVTKEDLKYLPSKDEFYEREDKIMGELKKTREELTILSHHSSDHSDRLEKLEKIHNIVNP